MTTDRIHKKALITPLAAGGNVLTDSAARLWHIVKTALVTQYDDVLYPIPFEATVRKSFKLASVAETRQMVALGQTAETILASTRYRVGINNMFLKDQSAAKNEMVFAYTSPAVLTGSADTDRYNVWYALAAKVNAYTTDNVEAFLMHKVAFTSGNSGTSATAFSTASGTNVVTYGSPGVQTTGGATFKVAACTTSGVFTGAATGTMYIYDIKTSAGVSDPTAFIASAVNTVTDPITAENITFTVAVAVTQGQGMVVVDDAGYYSQITGRTGISTVTLDEGFTTSTAVIQCIGVYSRGIGTDMLAIVPVFDRFGADIVNDVDGDQYMPGFTPAAGTTYTKCMLVYDVPVDRTGLMGTPQINQVIQVIWLAETTPADVTAFFTALNAQALVLTADQQTIS
jgi:hypothetical protein